LSTITIQGRHSGLKSGVVVDPGRKGRRARGRRG